MSSSTNQITLVFSAINNISKSTKQIESDIGRLTKNFTKLSGAIQNAFQFYVRYRIFGLISRGISAIENAIPSLIARGQEWAATVDEIADATGLAAGRSSTLASIAQVMTGSTDGLNRALGALANTTANHAETLRRYGIETRNASGEMLDSWTVLRNVRGALADLGTGFLTTAAARELFSRGGQGLLDMLTMTDAQFRMLEQDALRSGVVMTDAGLQAAEQWQRTQQRLEMSITGIANVITTTMQPTLTRLVDGITNYIRQNMTQIVGFVSRIIGFVMGMVSGFLGIDLNVESFFEKFDEAGSKKDALEVKLGEAAKRRGGQTKSEDAYTKAVQNQIDAIARQLAAMGRADRARDAREEQRRLLAEIAEARQELSDLRTKSIFAAGMSEREAELARQQHGADIVDAEKRITDAQMRMREHTRRVAMDNRRFELEQRRASLQEQATAHMKALAERKSRENEAMGQMFSDASTGIGDLPGNIQSALTEGSRTLKEGLTGGQGLGADIRRNLDSAFTWVKDDMVPALTRLADAFGGVAALTNAIVEWFPAIVGSIAALKLALLLHRISIAGSLGLTTATGAAATAAAAGGGGAAGIIARAVAGGTIALLPAAAAGVVVDALAPRQKPNPQGNFNERFQDRNPATARNTGIDIVGGIANSISDGFDSLHETVFGTNVQATAKTLTTLSNNTSNGGGSLAYWMQQAAMNTGSIARQPILGTANVKLYMPDGTYIVGVGNIPMTNSSSRTRRDL